MEDNNQNEPGQTAGSIMQEGTSKAIKRIVIFVSILVYCAGIVYAEVHGLNMLTKGVNPEFIMWAYIGMLALGLSALALPLALHYWTFAHMQRIFTFGFYALDLALLILNAFLDYAENTGGDVTSWGSLYLTYIMPATPIICAIGWSVIWLLDPSTKAHVLRQTLKNSIMEAKANQVAAAASTTQVSDQVKHSAQGEVETVLTELFGRPVTTMRMKEQTVVDAPKLKKAISDEVKKVYAPGTLFKDGTSLPVGWTCGNCGTDNHVGAAKCTRCSLSPDEAASIAKHRSSQEKPSADAPFPGSS